MTDLKWRAFNFPDGVDDDLYALLQRVQSFPFDQPAVDRALVLSQQMVKDGKATESIPGGTQDEAFDRHS